MQLRVVGLFYRSASARVAVEELRPGDSLTLEPEPDNPHDSFAIKVLAGSIHIGYLPRDVAAFLEPPLPEPTFVELETTRNTIYPIIQWD